MPVTDVETLEFLAAEYRTRSDQSDRAFGRVIQIAGIGFSAYGVMLAMYSPERLTQPFSRWHTGSCR